ncbi:hypothetical protein JHK85_016113 [Glycine max]|nr:hypothetical protein JHK85_016113 [Glycine max]
MGFSVVAIDVDVGLRNLGLENCVNHTFIEVLNDDKERQRNKGKKERERVVERELWHVCAGPLVTLPREGKHIFYFSRVHVEPDINEVFAQVTLLPEPNVELCDEDEFVVLACDGIWYSSYRFSFVTTPMVFHSRHISPASVVPSKLVGHVRFGGAVLAKNQKLPTPLF